MDYKKDMRIDEHALDLDCLEQAELSLRYGTNWSECQEEVELAEEDLKVIRSELIEEANDDPEECLGEDIKPTGPNVEAYYRIHKRHKKAKKRVHKAINKARIAEIAYKAVTYDRKTMLESLVKLHGQQYFAGPNVTSDISERRIQRNEKRIKTAGRIGSKMRRNRN